MKRVLLVLSFLWFAAPAQAQTCQIPEGRRLIPMAFEEITVSTTAIGFTQATTQSGPDSNNWARVAFVSVEDASLRWRVSGTPTASSGHLVAAEQNFSVCGVESLAGLLMIRAGGTNVKVSVSYFRLQ